MYQQLLKPILFQLPPEKAHHLTTSMLSLLHNIPGSFSILSKLFSYSDQSLERQVMGLTFKNPVGLAAGFDKDGKLIAPLSNLGFGFIEIGTITPKPQAGNPQPRLFRLPKDEALINRMGFNNEGVDAMVKRLEKLKKRPLIIGGNIGKNKITPNKEAIRDYEICFEQLFPYVDYFAVNVSSPNTPNLREFQDKEPLKNLLLRLQNLNNKKNHKKPVLLKIAPDLSDQQLEEICDIIQIAEISGVIATNTTISRKHLSTSITRVEKFGAGGLSGQPVRAMSTEMIRKLRTLLGDEKVIIGVGGIRDGESAIEKLHAGADLLQIYTGMIYEGPKLIKDICKAIVEAKD